MEELKRENQIEKIQELINKKDVSRRDFFGTLGKIAVLSQIVALGAGGFLASCVAFEDKKVSYGSLKACLDPQSGSYTCTKVKLEKDFGCIDGFSCGDVSTFICDPNYRFGCPARPTNGFQCAETFNGCKEVENGTHYECTSTTSRSDYFCNDDSDTGFTCTGGSVFILWHEGGKCFCFD